MPQNLIRFKIYTLQEVLPFVVFSKKKYPKQEIALARHNYDGKWVWMTSLRYQVFASKGTSCVSCGLAGAYFALEANPDQADKSIYHFNLYALDANHQEILMTKDHIIPKSKGGRDSLDNLQPMCFECNRKKGNSNG